CALVLIHHENARARNGSEPASDMDFMRGDSRLRGFPQAVLRVLEHGGARCIRFPKVNCAAQPDPIYFRNAEDGVPLVIDSPARPSEPSVPKGTERTTRTDRTDHASGASGDAIQEKSRTRDDASEDTHPDADGTNDPVADPIPMPNRFSRAHVPGDALDAVSD